MSTVDAKKLQSPTARKALAPKSKPYKTSLGIGATLGYYRSRTGAGSWKAILATPGGGQDERTIGRADDSEAADGVAILSYAEARRRVEMFASEHGKGIVAGPITIGEAITRYEKDLVRRGGNPANARAIRYHLAKAECDYLLPLDLANVTSEQFKVWGNAMLDGGMKKATFNRVMKSVHAAFNAIGDARVLANAGAWKTGLKFLAGANTARKIFLTDGQVRLLVASAYAVGGEAFGVWFQAHAELGSRSDQIARMTVGDVHGDYVEVPNSGKGKGKHKATSGATPLPLTANLAAKFAALAAGRSADDLLLTDPCGRSWTSVAGKSRAQWLFAKILDRLGSQVPQDITPIAFRHSSIQRALRARMPLKDIAYNHNTSMRMIEDNYAKGMDATAIERMRPTLLDTGPGHNVVTLGEVA